MIIALMALFVLGLYISAIRIKKAAVRNVLMVLSFIGLIASLGLMLGNERNHYGMKETETVSSQDITTMGNEKQPYGITLKNSLGSSANEDQAAYVYKDKDGKQQNLTPDLKKPDQQFDVSVHKKNNGQAQLITKTKKWVYDNDFLRFVFGVSGNENQTASVAYEFSIPQDQWYILTPDQVQKLQSMLKPSEAEQAQMQALAQANPEEYKKLINEKIKQTLGL